MKTRTLNDFRKLTGRASALVILALGVAALSSWAQVPQGCTPGGLGALVSITTPNGLTPLQAHVGDTLTITRLAANLSGSGCNLSNGNFWVTYPSGGTTQAMSGFTLIQGGELQCVQAPASVFCVGTLPTTYTIKAGDVGRNLTFTMPKGNQCVRPGAPNFVHFMVSDEADLQASGLTAAGCGNVAVQIITPGIACVKNCANGVGQNGQITFSGYVTNTGDTALFSVSVSNLVNGSLSLITNIATLNPGVRVNFGGSYTPANPCVPTTDTIFVRGTDIGNVTATSQCTATCSNIITPCISVTKNCTGPVLPGQTQTISGVVTNCGNVNLTNIVITDNIIGAVTTIPSLAIGQALPYSKDFTAGCNGNTNTVTATATSICGQPVTATATAVCPVTFTPCIAVTKNCNTVSIGQANTVSGIVTNCGNITVTNIVISDNLYGAIASIGSLAPGASASYSKLVTNAACGSFPNTVTATGRTICGQQIQATASAVCNVTCAPQICVTKEVACELPTGCGTYSEVATGVKSADNSQCPSFCYRVRVTNCGQEALNNVTVVDNVISLAGCNFPPTLAVGQTVECIVAGVEHCQSVTNTVTASGVGAGSGIGVSTNDTAAVIVRELDLTCELFVNGKPSIEIPCDGQPHLVTNALRVCNTGDLPIVGTIYAPYLVALGGDCANVGNIQVSLDPGQCTLYTLCVDAVTCPPDCGLAFSNYVKVTATVDLTKTNVCAWTRNATNGIVEITAETECVAVVECLPPPHTGCTPGFWKNCTIHWQPTGYRTDQSVRSVFTLGNCCSSLGNSSLLDALSFGGGSDVCGGARNLLRAGVAALLNASSPEVDYPLTTQQVIGSVNSALQSCNRATMIALASELDRDNNLGCRGADGNDLPCKRLTNANRAVPTR